MAQVPCLVIFFRPIMPTCVFAHEINVVVPQFEPHTLTYGAGLIKCLKLDDPFFTHIRSNNKRSLRVTVITYTSVIAVVDICLGKQILNLVDLCFFT